ncbi:MAG: hypothetical protein HY287_10510 [Planctomycetes bacterium]|nr:hypothetical protein [Planctomycetota bacterium]
MRCKEARIRWHQRIDGGAPDDRLEKHFETCASCRNYAARMTQVVDFLESLERETESVARSNETLLTKPVCSIPQSWPMRHSALLRIAAAIMVVALAGLWFLPRSNHPIGVASRSVLENQESAHPPSIAGGMVLNGESKNQFLAVAVQTGDVRVRAYRLYRQP